MKNDELDIVKNLRHSDDIFVDLLKKGCLLEKLNEFLLDYAFATPDRDGFIVTVSTGEEENVFVSEKSEFSLYATRSISVVENGDIYFHVVLHLKDERKEVFFLTLYLNSDLSLYDIDLRR